MNENFVCISSSVWDDYWRRRKYLPYHLSKQSRVLYLEPPVSFVNPIFFLKNFYIFNYKKKIRKINENLYVFPLIALIPFSRIKAIEKFNSVFMLSITRRVIRYLKISRPILLVWDFWEADKFIGKLDEKLVVFDWYDEWTGFFQDPKKIEFTIKRELKMVKEADIVVTVSTNLYEKAKKNNENVYRVTNGVDLFTNHHNYETADRSISEKHDIKKPIIGYMGAFAFSPKIDYELVKQIAYSKTCWSIVIIGKIVTNEKTKELMDSLPANVYFLGEKSRDTLPLYINNFDVAIIPWNISTLAIHSNPLKLFEYLACGKPVVSTSVPDIVELANKFPQLIKIANSNNDFIERVDESLKEDNEALKQERIKIAEQNSWEQKTNDYIDIIKKYLPSAQ